MKPEYASYFFKTALFTMGIAAAGLYGPGHLSRHLDQFWVEEAHQALLTGLVDSRNYAWENRIAVQLCAANASQQCLGTDVLQNGVVGWLSYSIAEDGAQTALNFYRFHAEYVALQSAGSVDHAVPLGFDSEGYSLQPEVIAMQIYSWRGLSDKNYTIVVEPSGALQTLVDANIESTRKVALQRWEDINKEG